MSRTIATVVLQKRRLQHAFLKSLQNTKHDLTKYLLHGTLLIMNKSKVIISAFLVFLITYLSLDFLFINKSLQIRTPSNQKNKICDCISLSGHVPVEVKNGVATMIRNIKSNPGYMGPKK